MPLRETDRFGLPCVIPVPVRRPLPYISMHIKKAPRVRGIVARITRLAQTTR